MIWRDNMDHLDLLDNSLQKNKLESRKNFDNFFMLNNDKIKKHLKCQNIINCGRNSKINI